jgi:xanthine dehydrogenase molybdopterin-binding subunit B
MEPQFGELFGAYVLTTVANANIQSIDTSKAMVLPGVVQFIQAKDIPGLNTYTPVYPVFEEVTKIVKVSQLGQSLTFLINCVDICQGQSVLCWTRRRSYSCYHTRICKSSRKKGQG